MRIRIALTAVSAACLSSILPALAGPRQQGELPYPQHPRHCKAVQELLVGGGNKSEALWNMDRDLKAVVLQMKLKEMTELLTLRLAADRLAPAADQEMARRIFDRPEWCARLLHNMDDQDDLNGVLGVLRTLHDHDPEAFERLFEFCLAYGVVWDQYTGHHWVKAPMEPDTMMATYRHYLENEKRMRIRPGRLPCELNVFVVGTRLSAAERDWVVKEYRSGSLDAAALYSSVPWTLNAERTVSPGHNKGLDIPYTLENIRSIGGCCMEQAYFTENVCRLFGVPAVYTAGRGRTSDAGHAWAGVLEAGSRNRNEWNFEVGRYDSHHYYKGQLRDPTHPWSMLTDSEVKILGALIQEAKSIEKIEESNFYLDAALWADTYMPIQIVEGRRTVAKSDLVRELLVESLDAARYNVKTWRYLSQVAAEKHMTEQQAHFWLDRAVKYTVEDYADFTVDLLPGFLGCIENPKRKLSIYQKLYLKLEKDRPDLACDIKILEGEHWMAQGDLRKGLKCFIYPLANFSEDRHILDTAMERLGTIESQIQDKEEIIRAYEMIVQTTKKERRKSRTMAEVLGVAASKLVVLYTEQGDLSKARKYERYNGK